MARFYYIGPWVKDAKDPNRVFHRAPVGAIGSVDFRARDGSGVGFFATEAPLLDSDYTAFGNAKGDRLDALSMDDAQRLAFAGLVGLDDVPASSTLLDLLWDSLTIHSDATGSMRAKPIMPTRAGMLELHLGGHALVRAVKMPADATTLPHWDKIRAVLQNGYREVEAVAKVAETQKGRETNQRWLGEQQEKYGFDAAQVSALLIPDDLPQVEPKKPETTITDDFNRADADPMSNAAGGWAWADMSPGSDWRVVSNQAKSFAGAENDVRAESDLSSADHYAQCVVAAIPSGQSVGPMIRVHGSDLTYYLGATSDISGGRWDLYKRVAGSYTALDNQNSGWASPSTTVKCKANGSTISVEQNGVEKISVTDTAISGNVRAGLFCYTGGGIVDDFQAADLGGGGVIAADHYYRNLMAGSQ